MKVASSGIVFTTIQKFLPEAGKAEYDRLSDRTNIVVIADEAHRTQYGFDTKLIDEKDRETKDVVGKRIVYGFAKYIRDALPNATYIGFTGTPIESTDIMLTYTTFCNQWQTARLSRFFMRAVWQRSILMKKADA